MAGSFHCVVPALAGWAGLGSGCLLLYQVFGFDCFHVRCKEGYIVALLGLH